MSIYSNRRSTAYALLYSNNKDSDQRLESVTSQVAERVLEEEDENDKQVACVSCY